MRDLKAKLSEYLREIRHGETVLVTDRGRVVAQVVPPGIEASELQGDELERRRMAAEGVVSRLGSQEDWPEPPSKGIPREDVDRALEWTRGDRRLSIARADARNQASEPLDLLVWAETAYPTTFGAPRSDEGVETNAEISHLVAALQVPLLFGTYDTDGAQEYIAAMLLGPDGARLGIYRKSRLFPLTGETPTWLEGARPLALAGHSTPSLRVSHPQGRQNWAVRGPWMQRG